MKNKLEKWILISISVVFLFIMLVIPLAVVITGALKNGVDVYIASITEKYTLKAVKLTLIATVLATILNTIFGVAAAWFITKFKFKHKNFLNTLIDLPFSISPIIAGLAFVLCFGRGGIFEGVINFFDIDIMFAVPAIVLATIFVTFPFISREIIPLMNSQGTDEEEAAAIMGANGFTIFSKVTLPNIKWGLLYGIVLCIARAMGEFGAVSVVSGHIRGKTNTLPLHVEILYNEYEYGSAFAVASILVIFAVIILIIRNVLEIKSKKEV
ncbi:MAG: sulfate ABC transporter permease subunit CysW [Clostridium sp.]|nr:sulfate ABC transporter permease subunit CysW [Clostridium sp.]